MNKNRIVWIVILMAVHLGCPPSTALETAAKSAVPVPNKVLWAWRRAENMTALNPREFAVAYLACQLIVSGESLSCRWRDQPLRVAEGSVVIPTVRIDVLHNKNPVLSDALLKKIADIVLKAARAPKAGMVQIDFDALETERDFYRRLLTVVRSELPETMPISITALASWCLFDNWIKELPVAETVPMMFSLGRDREKVLRHFRSGRDFMDPQSRGSLGLSLDDSEVIAVMIPHTRRRKIPVRVYLFSKTAWTEQKIRKARALLDQL